MSGWFSVTHLYGGGGNGGTPATEGWEVVERTSRELHYRDDRISIAGEGPRRLADGTRIWLVGDCYGFDDGAVGGSRGHTPRPPGTDPVDYCADVLDRHGEEGFLGLNGDFLVVRYDPEGGRLSFVTDRLSSIPLYHARTDDGDLVFSTNVQDVAVHPDVETGFDPGYLHEYLVFKHVFGVKTPFRGVEELHPGSITTFDLGAETIETDVYWRPRYRPEERPFEDVVEEFTATFTQVVDEWTDDGGEYGVLLSGGSDSRLILGVLGERAVGLHMTDWTNREARATKRAADVVGARFVPLPRGGEYRAGSIERNRHLSNFTGWFTQPYTTGMEDEIRREVDGLLSGLYADTLFKHFPLPARTLPLGPVGSLTLPIEKPIRTIPEYIDWLAEGACCDPDLPTDLRTVLTENVYREGGRIVNHGVRYDSIEEMVIAGNYYPLSNDDDLVFQRGLSRITRYRTPFLDDRLIDLSLSIPTVYRHRRNLINRAVERLDPGLATVAHAHTGVPLTWEFPAEYVARNLVAAWRKHVHEEQPPKPYMTNGPWLDDSELIRSHDFLGEAIERYADNAVALPGIDRTTVDRYYREHRGGADRLVELYTLMTVLSMPATERIATEMTTVSDAERVGQFATTSRRNR
jgi:asparagine synthase (glutamine-hydrolysing)